MVLALFCTITAIGQITVKGKVTDAKDNSPLPVTNGEGNYSIKVPKASDILVYSFIGYKTIEIKAADAGNVALQQDVKMVDEVVVTALGIKRNSKKLGYSMTEIKGDKLASKNTINPITALQGESAGVSIGGSDGGLFGNSKIQIRGVSTLNSNNNQPIFVIDGVILDNPTSNASADWSSNANDFGNILKNLNPDDFKSVSVLKGAAATALYGSRGINGVVIIETKDGSGVQGIGVSVKQSTGITWVYKTADMQNTYGAGTVPGYVTYGEKNPDGTYKKFDYTQIKTNKDGIPTMLGASSLVWGPKLDGRTIIGYDGKETKYVPYENNILDAYDLGINSNTSLVLKGGNKKGNFYLSDTYTYRKGTVPRNSFTKNSMLFKGSFELASWLKADASVSFTMSTASNPISDLAYQYVYGPFRNFYDTKKYKKEKYWKATHGGIPNSDYGDEMGNVPGIGMWFGLYEKDNTQKEYVTRPIVRLTANIIDNLSVAVEANMNYYTTKKEVKELGKGFRNEGGYYSLSHSNNINKTGKISLKYNKELVEGLNSNFILGGEINKRENSYTRVWTDGGLIVPGKYFLGNSKKTLKSEGYINGTKQINSVYFVGAFDYKGQLFLDVTGRNDWSSSLVYTDGTGNYSYFYPSVSSSWIFTESFEMPFWLSFGKVRASWAQVGSDTDAYSLNKGYSSSKMELSDGFIYKNVKSTTFVDPSIKPEKKNSFEVGADIRFFSNRLGFDVAYYDETITEQIGSIPLPLETGFGSIFTNVGTMTNKGFELSVSGKPVKTRDFVWESTFNYWNNKTKITELDKNFGERKKLGGDATYGNFRVASFAYEGGEYGVLMSDSNPMKDENGNLLLYWDDENRGASYKRSGKLEEVGKIQPDFEGSWKNEFRYKNISLSVLLDARFGGTMASFSNRYGTNTGKLETSMYGRDAAHGGITWTSKNPETNGVVFTDGVIMDGVFAAGEKAGGNDLSGLTYQEAVDKGFIEPTHAGYYHYFRNSWGVGVVNEDWVFDVNYISLRDINLHYSFPKTIASKLKMENLMLSFNAHNVLYLYNSIPNHLNPESFRGTTSTESFRERSFTPYSTTYTFSIKMDF